MVKFSAVALFILATAFTAEACTYCQCLFPGGGHCCVYSDAEIGNLDCPTVCGKAHRADGTNGADGLPGTKCGAGGYRCASAFTALDRTPCYKQ